MDQYAVESVRAKVNATSDWVRLYRKGDEHGILELLKVGKIELKPDEWLWKFVENPLGNFVWVCEHDNSVIGHMGYIPATLKIGDKRVLGLQTVDVFVHPEFRGRGILLAMGKASSEEALKRGMDIIYGFPNQSTGHLKYGGFVICRIPLLMRFISNKAMASYAERKYRIPSFPAKAVSQMILAVLKMRAQLYSRIRMPKQADFTICTAKSFDDRIDGFWESVSKCYDIIVVRNKEYLNWRYSKSPGAKYTILLAEGEGDILGYSVLRCKTEGKSRAGYIVDILASSENVATSLVSTAIEYFEKEKVDTVKCWMLKSNSYYAILRSCNFNPVGSTWFMARVNTSRFTETYVKNHTRWYVTIGDSDYV